MNDPSDCEVAGGGAATFVDITANTTGVRPIIKGDGEANTGLHVTTSGTGTMILGTESNEVLLLQRTASAVTYVDVTPGATGAAPIILGAGEANVGLTLNTSGTGVLLLRTGTGAVQINPEGNEGLIVNRTASAITYVDLTPGATTVAPILSSQGEVNTGFNVRAIGTGALTLESVGAGNVVLKANSTDMLTVTSSTSVGLGTNIPLVPAAVTGTPAQHALFRENVVKVWGRANTAGVILDSFNLTSVTDAGAGLITWTFDRDFVNSDYAAIPGAHSAVATTPIAAFVENAAAPAAGAVQVSTVVTTTGVATDPNSHYILVIGDQ